MNIINEDNLRGFINECINDMSDTTGEHENNYDHDSFVSRDEVEEMIDEIDYSQYVNEVIDCIDMSDEVESALPDDVTRDYQVDEVITEIRELECRVDDLENYDHNSDAVTELTVQVNELEYQLELAQDAIAGLTNRTLRARLTRAYRWFANLKWHSPFLTR